jgi:hypothetical protein
MPGLHRAVMERKIHIVEKKLNVGVNVNLLDDNGCTPLHFAVSCCHSLSLPILRLLIQRGANINQKNRNHQTPLHEAACSGNKEATHILLQQGANLTITNCWGRTPSQEADYWGKRECSYMIRTWRNGGLCWDLWEIETPQYQSYMQWLPREVMSEVMSFLELISHANPRKRKRTSDNNRP